jgi:hypothetical protein
MKTNIQQRSIHQRIEHFCRNRFVLGSVLTLLTLAIVKVDSDLLKVMRQAYAEGFGLIGMYMREETTRTPVSFETGIKVVAISGR